MPMSRRVAPLSVRIIAPVVAGLLILAGWAALAHGGTIPRNLLPTPGAVLARLGTELSSGRLLAPTLVTIQQSLLGCLLATVVALPIAYLIAQSITNLIIAHPKGNWYMGCWCTLPITTRQTCRWFSFMCCRSAINSTPTKMYSNYVNQAGTVCLTRCAGVIK